jgi:hypothetical protein
MTLKFEGKRLCYCDDTWCTETIITVQDMVQPLRTNIRRVTPQKRVIFEVTVVKSSISNKQHT